MKYLLLFLSINTIAQSFTLKASDNHGYWYEEKYPDEIEESKDSFIKDMYQFLEKKETTPKSEKNLV